MSSFEKRHKVSTAALAGLQNSSTPSASNPYITLTDYVVPARLDSELDDFGAGVPFVIRATIVAGNTVAVYTADTPFRFQVTGARVIATDTNGSGTVQVTDGTNPITDAIICAADTVVTSAGTIDADYNQIGLGASLSVVGANAADGVVYIDCIRTS